MASVVFQLKNSADDPLDGYVEITLDSVIVDADYDSHVPSVATVNLDASGQATVTLEPSEVKKVAYLFEVYENNLITPEPTDEDPNPDPIPSPILVWTVRAFVPDEPTVYFSDLVDQTSITSDLLSSSMANIAKLIASDSNFQSLAQVIFNHKGAWDAATIYRKGDLVLFDGSSYLYVNDVPTDTNVPNEVASVYWNLFVSKGDAGSGTNGNDDPFGITWNGALDAPSRNAVYDELKDKIGINEIGGIMASNSFSFASPQLQNSPTTVTPLANSNSSSIPNTSWVQDRIANFVDYAYLDAWQPSTFQCNPVSSRFAQIGTGATVTIDYSGNSAYYGGLQFVHRNGSNNIISSTIGRWDIPDPSGFVTFRGDFRFATPLIPTDDNTYRIGNSSSRWIDVFAVNGVIQTSDARQKTNIKPSDLGLDFINQLNPVKFNWIFDSENERPHYGLIAQELEEVLGNDRFFAGLRIENGFYSLNYSQLIAPLVKAVQELTKRVEELENG